MQSPASLASCTAETAPPPPGSSQGSVACTMSPARGTRSTWANSIHSRCPTTAVRMDGSVASSNRWSSGDSRPSATAPGAGASSVRRISRPCSARCRCPSSGPTCSSPRIPATTPRWFGSPDGQALVATLDFFTPIVDDPYDWGRIAATNALSDVYAMGARPFLALNIVGLAGGRPAARDARPGAAGWDRRREQGGRGGARRAHDHGPGAEVRDGRPRAGRPRTHRPQLDRRRPGRTCSSRSRSGSGSRRPRTSAGSPNPSSWPPPSS